MNNPLPKKEDPRIHETLNGAVLEQAEEEFGNPLTTPARKPST